MLEHYLSLLHKASTDLCVKDIIQMFIFATMLKIFIYL